MAQIEIAAIDLEALVQLVGLLELIGHDGGEVGRRVLERDAVLRTLRPGHRRLDGCEIETRTCR